LTMKMQVRLLRNHDNSEDAKRIAIRTAFVARFIVLREGRRSRAHRLIEKMEWESSASAETLKEMFLDAFEKNGDELENVERDLDRAFVHASCSVDHFLEHYIERATVNFQGALDDYRRSNVLLFGESKQKRVGGSGWRLPRNIKPSHQKS